MKKPEMISLLKTEGLCQDLIGLFEGISIYVIDIDLRRIWMPYSILFSS